MSLEKGIVVASDITQEWLLPWWWDHYQKYNSYPVTFVDLGLSNEMKAWCKEKGNYIRLVDAGLFVKEREEVDQTLAHLWEKNLGNHFWDKRRAWFRKPLACLQSPYETSLWIDSDCEIRGPLEGAFAFCNHPSGIAAIRETWKEKEVGINSGVIAFKKGAPLLHKWARLAANANDRFYGDQDLLDCIEKEQNIPLGELPSIYNWSHRCAENPEAIILHWHGPYAKEVIAQQLRKKNTPFIL